VIDCAITEVVKEEEKQAVNHRERKKMAHASEIAVNRLGRFLLVTGGVGVDAVGEILLSEGLAVVHELDLGPSGLARRRRFWLGGC